MKGEQDDEGVESVEQGEELFEQVNFGVDKGQAPLRIDKFLHNHLGSNISRTKIQYAADAGSVIVNGKPVKSNYKIRPLDQIQLLIPRHAENYDLLPEN